VAPFCQRARSPFNGSCPAGWAPAALEPPARPAPRKGAGPADCAPATARHPARAAASRLAPESGCWQSAAGGCSLDLRYVQPAAGAVQANCHFVPDLPQRLCSNKRASSGKPAGRQAEHFCSQVGRFVISLAGLRLNGAMRPAVAPGLGGVFRPINRRRPAFRSSDGSAAPGWAVRVPATAPRLRQRRSRQGRLRPLAAQPPPWGNGMAGLPRSGGGAGQLPDLCLRPFNPWARRCGRVVMGISSRILNL